MFSPHPVETTIFAFRALSEAGEMTYAHYADIISFNVLEQMTTTDRSVPGISPALADKVRRDYLQPADVKKIDIGGGLIHGSAEDFAEDRSSKIILAHTAMELSNAQRKIGSGAPFGTVDILIPSVRDYALRKARSYLTDYFPDVPQYDLEMLLNRPIIDINAETIVLRQGERCDAVTMPLTGLMEVVNNDSDSRYLLSSGTLIGESACLDDMITCKTYRAASFIKAITWPADLYRGFIQKNNLMESSLSTATMRSVFARTGLFGENVSIPVMNRLVRAASMVSVKSGEVVDDRSDCLFLIRDGSVQRQMDGRVIETLAAGDFFGEAMVLHGHRPVGGIVAHADSELIAIPGAMLRDIPIVRWKLFETYLRRQRFFLVAPGDGATFPWNADYALGIPLIDRQHQKLFEIANRVILSIDHGDVDVVQASMIELLDYYNYHLVEEMKYLESLTFPDLDGHAKAHKGMICDLLVMKDHIEKEGVGGLSISRSDFIELFQTWIIDHIFKEDRKFARYLYSGLAE
jgi:hemerythrin